MIADEILYQQVLETGSEAAMSELVARYYGALRRFLWRQTGSREVAEDLVQETFTRLIRYQGETPTYFKAWLYRIASNLAQDFYRSAYQRRHMDKGLDNPEIKAQQETLADSEALPEEILLSNEIREGITGALQQLSPAHREVVLLRFYHSMRLEEIAEVTGVSAGTVKSRLFYALKQLKVMIEGREVA